MYCSLTPGYSRSFQSTRPRGARLRDTLPPIGAQYVSIHAPARGATFTYIEKSIDFFCFNPRAREGRDCQTDPLGRVLMRFQSTRPRGARPFAALCCFLHNRFNPRAREGRDAVDVAASTAASWFQSTRPRGARPRCTTSSARGATCFNPRAREGRDWMTGPTVSARPWFQSTRPRGARREGHVGVDHPLPVSIHAPARGATVQHQQKRWNIAPSISSRKQNH